MKTLAMKMIGRILLRVMVMMMRMRTRIKKLMMKTIKSMKTLAQMIISLT